MHILRGIGKLRIIVYSFKHLHTKEEEEKNYISENCGAVDGGNLYEN